GLFPFFGIVKCFVFLRCFRHFRSEPRLLHELGQGASAKHFAAFDGMMLLSAGEPMFLAGLAKSEPIPMPERVEGPQLIGVEANVVADAPGRGAAVPEMEGHGIFRLSRLNPN